MRELTITDTTLNMVYSNKKPSLTFREKLDIARLLDKSGVSIIEIEGISNVHSDTLRIKSIAEIVKNSILSVPVSLFSTDVITCGEALLNAPKKRLQVFAPVSTVQMEYIYHKKSSDILEAVKDTIKECKNYTDDIEFTALDATRSDISFLKDIIKEAINAGATTITLCDTAGVMLPSELNFFITDLYENIEELKTVTLGFACSNRLYLAEALAITAVKCGASEIKVSAANNGGVSLNNFATLIKEREDSFKVQTGVKNESLGKLINTINELLNTDKNKLSPFENGVKDDSFTLSSTDSKEEVIKAAKSFGYELSAEDKEILWNSFSELALRKDKIVSREIEAIIASNTMQVPSAYTLSSYLINTGSELGSTAHISLNFNGEMLKGLSAGDGPIDAAYLAIEKITGQHYELDDFQIRSVTEGREAVGETITKLRHNGKLYSGKGISTDITESAIKAYLNALNKIAYEEGC